MIERSELEKNENVVQDWVSGRGGGWERLRLELDGSPPASLDVNVRRFTAVENKREFSTTNHSESEPLVYRLLWFGYLGCDHRIYINPFCCKNIPSLSIFK
ncbi:hypothetical protein J6590_012299 [Homalodisca vitripennis]|nr:hypothetical protein J6590_012299 [Homalodisca vitripennis]